jgi:cobalt/nickel transport system permease protein
VHIPDGYLSPQTAVVMYGAAMPFWYVGSRRVKQLLSSRAAPLVAIFAAFSFTIQMFNIPVPGGTTVHAVGSVLMAVILGPWAAVVGVSTAVVIQGLFFGDGGITAIGANCFNMAIVMPLAGYGVYRILAGRSPTPRRRVLAAALAGYAGINVAALLAGFELGLQPLLFSEGGRAIYNPYGLEVTIPAMMASHLSLAGIAEAMVTGLVVAYLLRAHPAIFEDSGGAASILGRPMRRLGWSLVGLLGALIILSPLGLLASGGADFEWSPEQLKEMIGYVPSGLARLGHVWQLSPLPDYQSGAGAGFVAQAQSYALSALLALGLIFTALFAARIILKRRAQTGESP